MVKKALFCFCLIVWLFITANAHYDKDSWSTDDIEDNFDELLSLHHSSKRHENDQKKETECTTPACKLLKTSVLSKMSEKYKPCDDMYMYACGGMIDKENKRTPQRDMSTFRELIEAQTVKLITIVEGLKDRKENDIYKKVYDWYTACSNTKEKKKLGASPLLKVLKSAGSWPILDSSWNEEDWDLEKALAFVHRDMSVFPLIRVSLDHDARNMSGSPYGLSFTNPPLGLDVAEFYLKKTKYSDKILYAYFQMLLKLSQLFGGKASILNEELGINIEDSLDDDVGLFVDIVEVVKFEMDIAKAISWEKRAYLVTPYTTLGQLQNSYGETVFDWKRYISLLYKDLPKQPPFLDNEVIYIEHPVVFKKLMGLIQTTNTRVLANYIMTKVLFEYGGALSPEFRQPYLDFYSAAYGQKTFSKLNVRCIRSVSKDLMFPVTALFVKDNLPEKDLKKAEELVNRLTESYLDHLDQNVKWMDNQTRIAALKKVTAMLAQVGYPREIRNITLLNEMYNKVKVSPVKYFDNVLRLNQLKRKNEFNLRGTIPQRSSWDMQLTQANAQYSASSNKITVAAGLLQPPLFHRDYPRARTFGSIGMAIGHEMTHGFDAYGARFDEKGNVHLWWTNKTYHTFQKKKKCMINEYSKFKVYNEHLHGQQTLDENIADNGGLRIAYEAYCRSLKAKPDRSLPGIKLTSKQLFFVSYGQLWCKHKTKAAAINSLHTDEHSPAKARVNIVLQNMKEFADTFKCPKGSPMNPKKKCVVW